MIASSCRNARIVVAAALPTPCAHPGRCAPLPLCARVTSTPDEAGSVRSPLNRQPVFDLDIVMSRLPVFLTKTGKLDLGAHDVHAFTVARAGALRADVWWSGNEMFPELRVRRPASVRRPGRDNRIAELEGQGVRYRRQPGVPLRYRLVTSQHQGSRLANYTLTLSLR